MPLSIQQAHALQPGDQLTFGTEFTYEVVSVQALGTGVYIELERSDGLLTSAREHDLDKAVLIEPEPEPVPQKAVAEKPEPEPPPAPKTKPAPPKRSAKS